MKPSQRRCRRPQVPLPRWQERPAASLGKVSWELSRSPSRAVRCQAATLSAHTGPKAVFPPAHPRSGESEDALGTSRPLAQFQATFAPPLIRMLPPAPLTSPPSEGTATGHTIPAKVPLWLPSLAWGDSSSSCPVPPLMGVSLPTSSGDLLPPVATYPPPVFPLPDLLRSGASVPPLPDRKIVRSISIFPAISAPLCKEK